MYWILIEIYINIIIYVIISITNEPNPNEDHEPE